MKTRVQLQIELIEELNNIDKFFSELTPKQLEDMLIEQGALDDKMKVPDYMEMV